MKLDQKTECVRRLRCAAGHLNAVIKMVEAGEPCEQVLHQLGAVEAAIRAAGVRLIICQAQSSQAVILGSPSPEERLAELKHIQALYMIFTKYSNQNIEVTP